MTDIVYTQDDIDDGVEITIAAKRDLGNGRWDKILKRRMVELSEADNYHDAREEWKATGRCWWGRAGNRVVPAWITHPNSCLCGHDIYYHFEIENTSNGVREIVGSEHIHSYLILREISESTGVDINAITERMIQRWISVRVRAMIQEAWWEENGDEFEEMFDEIKELDLRLNVRTHPSKKYWDRELRQYRPVTYLRKRTDGTGVRRQIASVVWRWNHPDNGRNQQTSRGYPNDVLWADMLLFSAMLEDHLETVEELDDAKKTRLKELKNWDGSQKIAIAAAMKESADEGKFAEKCVYFGILYFKPEMAHKKKDVEFLNHMKTMITNSKEDNLLFKERDLVRLDILLKEVGKPLASTEQRRVMHQLRKQLVEVRHTLREAGVRVSDVDTPNFKFSLTYFPYKIPRQMTEEDALVRIGGLTQLLDVARDFEERLNVDNLEHTRQNIDGGE
jgi:hypothetical protein